MIKRFLDFICGIREKDKIAIIYHTDADGVCSAVIASRALERLGKKVSDAFSQKTGQIEISGSTISHLVSLGATKVIILDLAVDSSPDTVKAIEHFAEVLVLDHHITSNDLNSTRTTMIKSQDVSGTDPSQYCTSKLIYDLFLQLEDIKDLNWISAIGIIGDFGIKTWNAFIGSVAENDPEKMNYLFRAEESITFAQMCDGEKGLKKAYGALNAAKSAKDVVEALKEYEFIRNEISAVVDDAEKNAEIREDIGLVFYKIRPTHNIKSKVSNILSSKRYPKKTVVVVQMDKNNATVSARCQDGKVSMNDLMRQSTKNLKYAKGGGHVPAAGGSLRIEDVSAFRRNVIDFLEKHKKINPAIG